MLEEVEREWSYEDVVLLRRLVMARIKEERDLAEVASISQNFSVCQIWSILLSQIWCISLSARSGLFTWYLHVVICSFLPGG